MEMMHNTTQSCLISNYLQQIATEGISRIYNSRNIWSFDAITPWASPPSIVSATPCSNRNEQMLESDMNYKLSQNTTGNNEEISSS